MATDSGTYCCGTPAYFYESHLLAWQLGHIPHAHDFRQLPQAVVPRDDQTQGRPVAAICAVCSQVLTVRCTNLGLGTDSVACSQGYTHHFHWASDDATTGEDQPSSSPLADAVLNANCCQCAFSIALTLTTPTIPTSTLLLLERTKAALDSTSTARQQRLGRCLETLTIYVTNLLEGRSRAINTANKSFQERVGLDTATQACFESLGFTLKDGHFEPPLLSDRTLRQLTLAKFQLQVKACELYRAMHGGQDHPKFTFAAAKAPIGHALGAAYPKRSQTTTGGTTTDYLTQQQKPLSPSYGVLGTVADMDDTVLAWVYRLLAQEDATNIPRYLDALYDLALGRSSDILRAIVDSQRIDGHYTTTDIQRAYQYFEADEATVTDYHLAHLYKAVLFDRHTQEAQATAQLRVLAAARRSSGLTRFLDTGDIESLEARTPVNVVQPDRRLPAGLHNIGNTCYLNSLLQYYFTVLPLREVLQDTAHWNVAQLLGRRDGSRPVTRSEIHYAVTFVDHLRSLFTAMQTTTSKAITPNQELARQALTNAREQAGAIETLPPTASASLAPNARPTEPSNQRSLASAMDVDAGPKANASPVAPHLATPDAPTGGTVMTDAPDPASSRTAEPSTDDRPKPPSLPPRPTRSPMSVQASAPPTTAGPSLSLPKSQMVFGRQQDVTECMENIMYLFETALQPDDSARKEDDNEASATDISPYEDPRHATANVIHQLFFGVLHQALEYHDAQQAKAIVTTKHELFNHVIIQAADDSQGPQDIYRGLDGFFGQSAVSFANTEATRKVYADKLPPFLHVQIQRVQYDVQRGRVYKNNAHVAFEPVIYLDRYIVANQPQLVHHRQRIAELQRQIEQAQATIRQLTENPDYHLDVPDMLQRSIQHLKERRAEADTTKPASKDTGLVDLVDIDMPAFTEAIECLEAIQHTITDQTTALSADITAWQAEIKGIFADLQALPYRAHAVFMHRGEASYGHYWVYIRDHAANVWLKYNDTMVSQVNDAEVFGDTTGSNCNPYLVVYVQDQQLTTLTRTT
ncbi:ubiquitin-specific protease ubp2 [Dimargaris xerosporica]|nr:ubiquitin-specific protease ubp2 [Dimargaris xerosporica]